MPSSTGMREVMGEGSGEGRGRESAGSSEFLRGLGEGRGAEDETPAPFPALLSRGPRPLEGSEPGALRKAQPAGKERLWHGSDPRAEPVSPAQRPGCSEAESLPAAPSWCRGMKGSGIP